jgi:hypothetical protein
MHKPLVILLGILIVLIGGGYWLINSNPKARMIVENLHIIDPLPLPEIPASRNSIFIIGDGSGSGSSTYSVPRITTQFIEQVINRIQTSGSGEIWLTFIDMNATNNEVLHFSVPAPAEDLSVPVQNAGERKAEFDKRMKTFREDSASLRKIAYETAFQFNDAKQMFLAECQKQMNVAYGPKKPGTDYSDIIGCVNAGNRSLETVLHDSIHFRSLLVVSDGVQTYHPSTPKNSLKDLPEDVSLVVVNHAGSKGSVLDGKGIEVDNLDRALDKVIQIYNR